MYIIIMYIYLYMYTCFSLFRRSSPDVVSIFFACANLALVSSQGPSPQLVIFLFRGELGGWRLLESKIPASKLIKVHSLKLT